MTLSHTKRIKRDAQSRSNAPAKRKPFIPDFIFHHPLWLDVALFVLMVLGVLALIGSAINHFILLVW